MSFRDRFVRLKKEKNSVLCIGLDPALPTQRRNNTLPLKYVDVDDENQTRLDFCFDIIEMVKDYAVAIKPNQQYVFGFAKKQHKELTSFIKIRMEMGSKISINNTKITEAMIKYAKKYMIMHIEA